MVVHKATCGVRGNAQVVVTDQKTSATITTFLYNVHNILTPPGGEERMAVHRGSTFAGPSIDDTQRMPADGGERAAAALSSIPRKSRAR